MVVRTARETDLAQIADVFSRSFRTMSFLPDLHSVEEDRAFWRDDVLRHQTVLVAERDARIMGVLAHADGWVNQLYVDPDQRGNGVGSALIAEAKRVMGEIQLWCFEGNLAGRRFYETHGFSAAERTDGSGNEAKCADLRFVWKQQN